MIDSGDARNPSSNSPSFEGLFLDKEGAPRQTEDTGFVSHEVARPRQEQDGQRETPRDNGKLLDEVLALKMELNSIKKRFHELDVENRKLEHGRGELARVYKNGEAN